MWGLLCRSHSPTLIIWDESVQFRYHHPLLLSLEVISSHLVASSSWRAASRRFHGHAFSITTNTCPLLPKSGFSGPQALFLGPDIGLAWASLCLIQFAPRRPEMTGVPFYPNFSGHTACGLLVPR